MWGAILVVLNLIFLESLLSVDNAAVLATMVGVLPEKDRSKALKWGIWGAFILRGLSLFFVGLLIKMAWLKFLGGAYLMYLAYKHFAQGDGDEDPESHPVYKWMKKHLKLNLFWSTVIMVEVMDLAFSIDNVFAAVALTKNMWLIWTGVFIGILAMRFVAQKFVILMGKYPQLTASAYTVIALLGIKLIVEGLAHYWAPTLHHHLESHAVTLGFSALTMFIFFFPLLRKAKPVSN